MPQIQHDPLRGSSGPGLDDIRGQRIVEAQLPHPNAPTQALRLVEWRRLDAGALIGRATVEFGGLVISDIGIFEKEGRRWSQMPAEPMRDREGQVLKDERGKTRYRSALKWKSRDLQERFSHALIAAIEMRHGALGEGP